MGGEIGDSVLFTGQEDGRILLEVIKKKKLSELSGALKSSVVFKSVDNETKSI